MQELADQNVELEDQNAELEAQLEALKRTRKANVLD